MNESSKKMAFFERYLTVWVLLCMGLGIALGELAGETLNLLTELEYAGVNLPIMVLIWAMVFPMMVQIDFSSLARGRGHGRGLGLTLTLNWLIKPFTMAAIAWLFFHVVYQNFFTTEEANDYLAGAILLGAAPCTAMVFVWSYLSGGNANYTLVQVAVNDLVLLVAFVPIVSLLLGVAGVTIPWDVLAMSVVAFVVVPLLAGWLVNRSILARKGEAWLKDAFLPKLKPVSIIALLATLVLLFAFQGRQILAHPLTIVLLAIPLTLQTYLIYFIGWFSGKFLKLPYTVCAPGAMIGASNFFELAVAVAIALFGLDSGAALTTVVGVLIEVPVMLSLVRLSLKWRY